MYNVDVVPGSPLRSSAAGRAQVSRSLPPEDFGGVICARKEGREAVFLCQDIRERNSFKTGGKRNEKEIIPHRRACADAVHGVLRIAGDGDGGGERCAD